MKYDLRNVPLTVNDQVHMFEPRCTLFTLSKVLAYSKEKVKTNKDEK